MGIREMTHKKLQSKGRPGVSEAFSNKLWTYLADEDSELT